VTNVPDLAFGINPLGPKIFAKGLISETHPCVEMNLSKLNL